MKVLVLIALVIFQSCASRAPLTYKQTCGAKGMVLAGVREDSGSTSSYSYDYGRLSGYYDGESVQCVVPQNKKQECEAHIYGQAARPIMEYNDGIGGKRVLTGAGYYALILPGIGLKLYYDKQRDLAVQKAMEIEKEAFYGCSISEEREPASK